MSSGSPATNHREKWPFAPDADGKLRSLCDALTDRRLHACLQPGLVIAAVSSRMRNNPQCPRDEAENSKVGILKTACKFCWLGGRPNAETQIQSPLNDADNEADQQLSSENSGEVRQNPQCGRNEITWNSEEDTLP
jgi:hypothetical protein